MLKLSDMLISAIIKKGILYEGRNCEMEFDVPTTNFGVNEEIKENVVRIRLKAEHMTIRIEKDNS